MLIRLCGHYQNNPNHIDKLIAIKGLPEEWFFKESRYGGKELIRPWEPDVEANIPKEIRHLCEKVEVTKVFPPIEKGRDPVVDKVEILGVRFDFMTQPGQELWEKIERYVDRMTPRDQKIPVPVLVAPNHKTGFDPHAVRRTVRGSIELYKSEIPEIDLRVHVTETITGAAAPQPAVVVPPLMEVKRETVPLPPAEVFNCDQCQKQFLKKQALVMHIRKGHKKAEAPKEKVGA